MTTRNAIANLTRISVLTTVVLTAFTGAFVTAPAEAADLLGVYLAGQGYGLIVAEGLAANPVLAEGTVEVAAQHTEG